MDPANHTLLRDRFHAVADNITKGLSTNITVAANGHWEKWAALCRYVSLYPVHILYRDLFPILNAFARKYRTGAISPSIRQV